MIGSILVSWSVAISAIGYARKYLNFDSDLRKIANEGIYPFYLLHQPVIVITGYYLVCWNIPAIIKFILILLVSFFITVLIYQLIIQRIGLFRIIFGLKPRRKSLPLKNDQKLCQVLSESK
jgi:hypothetical protein